MKFRFEFIIKGCLRVRQRIFDELIHERFLAIKGFESRNISVEPTLVKLSASRKQTRRLVFAKYFDQAESMYFCRWSLSKSTTHRAPSPYRKNRIVIAVNPLAAKKTKAHNDLRREK